MNKFIEAVIGVPGPWSGTDELAVQIALENDRYRLTGDLLLDTRSGQSFTVEVREHDSGLAEAFRHAGSFTAEELQAIDGHKTTAYLLVPLALGQLTEVYALSQAVGVLLRAGGLAVKIESSGIGHTVQDWLELTESKETADILRAYVPIISDESFYFSCGMHHFGCEDVKIDKGKVRSADEASQILFVLMNYLVDEHPKFLEGDTFSTGPDEPVFQVWHEACETYAEDDLFFNPFGYLRLT